MKGKGIAIIGAGRLGTSLAFALSKNGYMIDALSCRSRASAEESRDKIGSSYFMIRAEDKACYHTACSMTSNLSVALFYTALRLLSTCGLEEDEAKKILWPLLEGTLHNVNKINIFEALTGPVTRGDLTTVTKHLKELKKFPTAHRIYVDLAKQALEMAKQGGKTPSANISALEARLERE